MPIKIGMLLYEKRKERKEKGKREEEKRREKKRKEKRKKEKRKEKREIGILHLQHRSAVPVQIS